MQVKDRVFIVTGASSGIGLATAIGPYAKTVCGGGANWPVKSRAVASHTTPFGRVAAFVKKSYLFTSLKDL